MNWVKIDGECVYIRVGNLIPLEQICILLDHKQATSRDVRICLGFAPEMVWILALVCLM